MGKLLKLKTWLTLPESAKHLSTAFGEEVTEADVLRLALDHKLTLSVVFADGVLASVCKPVADEDLRYAEVPPLNGSTPHRIPLGGQILYHHTGQTLQVQKEVFYLDDDCYDLTMAGGERADVEQLYWSHVGGAREETTSIDGVFISCGHGHLEKWYQLKDRLPAKNGEASFYPLGCLPARSMLVVRTSALIELEQTFAQEEPEHEKPLSTTERNTLLKLLIGMAVGAYRYDPSAAKSSVPKEIADDLAQAGLSITDDTVRTYLKKAASLFLPQSKRTD